jgi:hypothetical protein
MKKTLYINSHCTLQRDQNTLLLEMEDGTKRYLPVEGIRELHIFSEVNLNKRVLEFLSQNQIIVHFYNYYGYYTGSYYPREHFNSGYMLLKQARGGQHPVLPATHPGLSGTPDTGHRQERTHPVPVKASLERAEGTMCTYF